MKKLLLTLMVLAFAPSQASAWGFYPYFRPLDINHLQPVGGALIDVREIHLSEATGLLPLLTHSPKDGQIFPWLAEDWSPLAVGGSVIAGRYTFIVAPLFNVLPVIQALAYQMTPDTLPGLQRLFSPTPANPVTGLPTAPATFSAGPAWEYKSATNKGYFRVFTGLALHF